MNREERIKLAIEKGITYNPETGIIYGIKGDKIKPHKTKGYIQLNVNYNKKNYGFFGHQFAWYWVNKEVVECLDHINGIKDDNRIVNLRSITRQENQWNQSNPKGSYWSKKYQKWSSSIQKDDKQIWLGYFDTEEEARQAYLDAKAIYHII